MINPKAYIFTLDRTIGSQADLTTHLRRYDLELATNHETNTEQFLEAAMLTKNSRGVIVHFVHLGQRKKKSTPSRFHDQMCGPLPTEQSREKKFFEPLKPGQKIAVKPIKAVLVAA